MTPDGMNEVFVVEGTIQGKNMLFMIDTGYAGPPVLSTSYLSVAVDGGPVSKWVPPATRMRVVKAQLRSGVGADAQQRAIQHFLDRSGCVSYTSGCTMRLMSIGTVVEQQADMLLCASLQLRRMDGTFASPLKQVGNAEAGVFVTSPLPTSVHILTCDYLLQSAPLCLRFGKGEIEMHLSPLETALQRQRSWMQPAVTSGGAFVVRLRIGGTGVRCTVDTGAPGPICLGPSAAQRATPAAHHSRTARGSVCSSRASTANGCARSSHERRDILGHAPAKRPDLYQRSRHCRRRRMRRTCPAARL